MKKSVFVLLMVISIFTACIKKDTSCSPVNNTAPASEIANLKTFIDTNGIVATEDPRGFFYSITKVGTGSKPNACSSVLVNYVGRLTSGATFDQGNDVSFSLRGLIVGWQEAIPLVAAGGSITFWLPPSLAYGASGQGSIPPNANLIFTIDLKGIY